jgi:hypothetical protein
VFHFFGVIYVRKADGYAITLAGTDTGTMDYTLRFFDGEDNLTDERRFAGVPITAATLIYTDADKEATVLRVDADGDGDIDDTWTARARERRVLTRTREYIFSAEERGSLHENQGDTDSTGGAPAPERLCAVRGDNFPKSGGSKHSGQRNESVVTFSQNQQTPLFPGQGTLFQRKRSANALRFRFSTGKLGL